MGSLCGLCKNVEPNDEDGRLVIPADGSVSFQLPPPTPRKTFPEKSPNDSPHIFILILLILYYSSIKPLF